MLIDLYGLLPWSRTAASQPQHRRRGQYLSISSASTTHKFLGRQLLILWILLLLFPVMVHPIEPVPSASWSPQIRPSYVPASTSQLDESGAEFGSGWDDTTTTSTSTSAGRITSQFALHAGRRAHRKHHSNSTDPTGQNHPRRRGGAGGRVGTIAADQSRTERNQEELDQQPAAAVVRWYRLYNRCSGGYLQMYMNDVNARGKYASPLVQLRVETDSYGSRIRIQSQKFGKYLCFNRRQRITGKYNGRSERCVFVEKISDNHYTELESAWRPGLYLGFNRGDGKFLDPSRYYTDRRTCFQFIKNANTSYVDTFNAEANGGQQHPNVGPSDFTRLSPERQRWLRARMHQEAEMTTSGDGEDDAWRHQKQNTHQHRIRHDRARLRHQHQQQQHQRHATRIDDQQ